uniref:DUF5658 domain-containing protein n=1 Tax=Schlesneria paludicola TaxID=360056 RepID=A0A7C2K0M2_9PLAN
MNPSSSAKRGVPAEHEYTQFVLVSALDVFATYLLLQHGGFRESNPLAQFFLHHWGVRGMVYFKFGMVAFICTIAYVVGQHRPKTARRLLQFATLVVGAVVVYSVVLFIRHGGHLPLL